MSARLRRLWLVPTHAGRVATPAEQARIHAREHAESLATQIDRGATLSELAPTLEAMAKFLRRAEELDP